MKTINNRLNERSIPNGVKHQTTVKVASVIIRSGTTVQHIATPETQSYAIYDDHAWGYYRITGSNLKIEAQDALVEVSIGAI